MNSIDDVAHSVLPTLLELARHKWDTEATQVLEAATGTISQNHLRWDNEDTQFYELNLRVPAAIFTQVEAHLTKIQERLEKQLQHLGVGGPKEVLDTVRILPELVAAPASTAVVTPFARDVARIWKPNQVRLFISHVSAVKVAAATLKKDLVSFGVDSFVAHEDIEPTREWMAEIDIALRSMHVMCGLVTLGFNASAWTHQEVGFAMGRDIPVILVKGGEVPLGLMGKHQALAADLNLTNSAANALKIITALWAREHTRTIITQGIVEGLAHAWSFASAKASAKLLATASGLSRKQIDTLLDAMNTNSQVKDATGVPGIIRALAKRHGVDPASRDVVPQAVDDEIPF